MSHAETPTDETTPTWPPAPGDKVLPRHVTGDPGPTYVLTEPTRSDGELVVETVTHHLLEATVKPGATAGGIENPVESAREAIQAGQLSPETTRVDDLNPYVRPKCERCQDARAEDRPVLCSVDGEQVRVWLCRYCIGFYDGLSAGLDEVGRDPTKPELGLAGDGRGGDGNR